MERLLRNESFPQAYRHVFLIHLAVEANIAKAMCQVLWLACLVLGSFILPGGDGAHRKDTLLFMVLRSLGLSGF